MQGCKKEGDHVLCESLPRNHELNIESPDSTALLIDFLSEALYLSDLHDEAYFDATIHEMSDTKIHATIHGVLIKGYDVSPIKGVSPHQTSMSCGDGIWRADIVCTS